MSLDPADGGTGDAAAWSASLDAVGVFGARLTALTAQPRPVFTAVLVPVANPAAVAGTSDQAAIDEAIIAAEAYDDAFAKLVHARQPASSDAHVRDGKNEVSAATDAGIQVGWDDEQILTWHNRQVEIANGARRSRSATTRRTCSPEGWRPANSRPSSRPPSSVRISLRCSTDTATKCGSGSVAFARYVSPNAFGVAASAALTEITVQRPRIGYPEALFTTRNATPPVVRAAARSAMLAQLGLGPDGLPSPPAERVPDSNTVGVPDPGRHVGGDPETCCPARRRPRGISHKLLTVDRPGERIGLHSS